MELEVRHLRALCAIADTGSVRKAARQLGMTQPSLTTQLRRIESALGGQLFSRERTGSRPTPLGRTVLCRARPLVAEMNTLVAETQAAVVRAAGPHLRIGGTASRAMAGWVSRVHARLPDADTTIRVDVSANALLQMVALNQLDVAFVHEVEGAPLRIPDGLERRVLVAREPQFIALHAHHPAARQSVVPLSDVAGDRWMVDPSVDGEWDGVQRALRASGFTPRVAYGDYLTAADMVAAGEAVAPCQPTSQPRHGMAIRPLRGDPIAVELFMASRALPEGTAGEVGTAEVDALYADLVAAYREAAAAATTYRQWLARNNRPLLYVDEDELSRTAGCA
ncbi:LysR family transcriptional regulator [Streptomyces fildesensis]|uniref:LysR family transcriptional regulator n=1 Tax=Streptomyces fildesensis TaxID=375757 RepID=A0ABW8C9T1_9ACTN